MREYLELIDHFTKGRADVTPLFGNYAAFKSAVNDLLALTRPSFFNVVVGIDALGFVLGAALAQKAGVGFVPIRKAGKLPVATDTETFEDYDGQTKTLEVRRDAFQSGFRVLIVDEWIETGAQVIAAGLLVERQGAEVVGVATIQCDDAGRKRVSGRYPVTALA